MQVSSLATKSVKIVMCRLLSPICNPQVGKDRYEKLANVLGDIRPIIKQLTIYENILTPTLIGRMLIQDSVGLSTLLPLIGMEQLQLVFRVYDPTTNQDVTYGTVDKPITLVIYAQTSRSPQTMGAEEYELLLVSPEFLASKEKKISRAYTNQKIETIIKDVFKKDLQSIRPFVDVESTNTPTNIVFPFVSPLDAVKLLMLYGQNDQQETNYLFYETLEGFHFHSMRQAIRSVDRKKIPTVTMELAGLEQSQSSITGLVRADQIDVTSGFDMLNLMSEGYFASSTYMIDVLDGSIDIVESRSADRSFATRPRVSNVVSWYDVFSKPEFNVTDPTAKMFLVPTTEFASKNTNLTSKDGSIKDNFIARTMDGRNREFLSLLVRTVRARIPGNPMIRAGKMVNVVLPTPLNNQQYATNVVDIASKNYFVVAAQHSLINTGNGEFLYETIFEAGTDS